MKVYDIPISKCRELEAKDEEMALELAYDSLCTELSSGVCVEEIFELNASDITALKEEIE